MVKKTLGRRKVEMKKMENENNLQVTFSRRRDGLFKKANELSILCGAEVGVVVFSPKNKPYSFGSPSMRNIVDRLEGNQSRPQHSTEMQHVQAHQQNAAMRALSEELHLMEIKLKQEKKYGEELNETIKARENKGWWESPIEDLNLHQLEQFKAALQHLRGRVTGHVSRQISKMQLECISKFLLSD